MSLKSRILITFFAMPLFFAQSTQAMEWATALKLGTPLVLGVGITAIAYVKKNFGSIKQVEKKVDALKEQVNGVDKKIGDVKGDLSILASKVTNEFKQTLSDLQELRTRFDAMQNSMSTGFSEARDAYEVLKRDLESRLQQVETRLLTQFDEQSEALKLHVQSMVEAVKRELFAKMDALESKIVVLATKNDVQDTVDQALNPINEQLNRIEASQERQTQLFENALQLLERRMREGNREVVHTIQGLPTMFALSGYMLTSRTNVSAQLASPQRKLIGNTQQ